MHTRDVCGSRLREYVRQKETSEQQRENETKREEREIQREKIRERERERGREREKEGEGESVPPAPLDNLAETVAAAAAPACTHRENSSRKP